MLDTEKPPAFPLGCIGMTSGVRKALSLQEITEALMRHMGANLGRNGGLFPRPRRVLEGCRVLSAYRSSAGLPFWIITEADHSKTTILLPCEY
jgi:hypothetical protein